MNSSCIITQGHISEYDPQGDLSADEKLELFNVSLAHLRQNNPASYIILTGHGDRKPNVSFCDWHYWEDKCRPLDASGYPIGIPAQYPFVDAGIEHAQKLGFQSCLKTRTDCVIQRKNITDWCQQILLDENKRVLLTQQTGDEYVGDCFMYGAVDDMRKVWHKDNPVVHPGGLMNTAANFKRAFPFHHSSMLEYLREYSAFRDVIDIPFLCLRWNYRKMINNGDWNQVLNNKLDVNEYHWGKANNWHVFDESGKMIVRHIAAFWSKEDFYSK